jgi:hypothetical protein
MTQYRRDSFIRRGDLKTGVFLDVNRLPSVPHSLSDEAYVIEPMYENRLDLLAYNVYGNSRLWWVIALRNIDVIKDPLRDAKAGITIQLPNPETLKRFAL